MAVKDINNTDQSYDYVKEYIREAAMAREPLKRMIERVILAYKQIPCRNTYKENAMRYYKTYASNAERDPVVASCLKASCDSIPEATNSTIFNAVETITSMAQGGIGQFEYKPADEYLSKDPELSDMQAAFLKYMYEKNHMDGMAPNTVRKGVMQGQFNWMIKPCKNGDNTDFKISLIDAYHMVEDPRSSKTNRSRYIGYQEVQSWTETKEYLNTVRVDGDLMVKVVNDVDMYLNELKNYGNPAAGHQVWASAISEDLDTFSSIYSTRSIGSETKDKNGNHKDDSINGHGYKGDDVEVTYLWDLISDIYFVVINRRFIVYKKEHPLQKTIKIEIPYKDPKTGDFKSKTVDYTVKVNSPLIHRGYIDADWETFPVSPVFYCLNDFDNLCSKESVLEHDLSIMAPITFLSTSFDAEKIAGMGQIAGQIVEGSQNTFQVLNKTYDLTAITTSIQRTEDRIKRMMGATDQFELMALLNNRATGAEVSMANGAVSQRMNILLAQLESGYSELMTKLLSMMIIFSDDDTFTFPYKDGVMALDRSDLVGNSLIRVKLASRIKIEQQEQSQNALMVLQTLAPLAQQGVNIQRVITATVPVITQGVVNRRTAESFIDDSLKIDPAQLNAAINDNEKRRKAEAQQGPISLDMMSQLTPENVDELEQMYGQMPQDMPQDQSQQAQFEQEPTQDQTTEPTDETSTTPDYSQVLQDSQLDQGSGQELDVPTSDSNQAQSFDQSSVPNTTDPTLAGQLNNQSTYGA